MKLRTILTMFVFAGFVQIGATSTAEAHEEFQNLTVLKDTGKKLEKGMKNLSKGLGVKCTACHVKGEFENDKVKTKDSTRTFFKAVVGKKEGREAALKALLAELKLEKPKKVKKVWAGVDMFVLKK